MDRVTLKGVCSGPELVEELDQRNVGFGDRLEEPPFLEEAIVFRMPHVGQMSVQDQQQVTLGHERISMQFAPRPLGESGRG